MKFLIKCQGKIYPLEVSDTEMDAEQFIEFITASSLPDEIKDALFVRLGDRKIDMYGGTVQDKITRVAAKGHTRYSLQVHPYPWQPSGASNVVVYKNALNELSVALVYNQRKDKRAPDDPLRKMGVPFNWTVPEGYRHPPPCKGGEEGISIVSEVDMDEAEERIVKGCSPAEAYQAIANRLHSPASKHVTPGHDKNLRACADRELGEEIGLNPPASHVNFVTMQDGNVTVGIYLVKANNIGKQGQPVLKADGTEILHAEWGRLKGFQFKKNAINGKSRVEYSYYDDNGNEYPVEVSERYAIMIGQGIEQVRNQEIQELSRLEEVSLFSTRENVEAKVKQILKSKSLNPENKRFFEILGETPEEYLKSIPEYNVPGDTPDEKDKNLKILATLGKHAEGYHKKILALVHIFTNTPADKILKANELIRLLQDSTELDENRFSSRVHSLHAKSEFSRSAWERVRRVDVCDKTVSLSSLKRENEQIKIERAYMSHRP